MHAEPTTVERRRQGVGVGQEGLRMVSSAVNGADGGPRDPGRATTSLATARCRVNYGSATFTSGRRTYASNTSRGGPRTRSGR
jgi:hypothetical protein